MQWVERHPERVTYVNGKISCVFDEPERDLQLWNAESKRTFFLSNLPQTLISNP